MKKYLIILILLLSRQSFAQNLIKNEEYNSCGTPEATDVEMQAKFYYGNNDRLQEKYDSLAKIYGNVSSNTNYRNGTFGGEDNIWFRIPIKFWIYQWQAAGISGILPYSERSVKSMVWALNDAYRRNNIPVRFFASCYQFVEHQTAGNGASISDSDVKDLMSSNKEFAAINIHIIKNPSGTFYSTYDNWGNAVNSICLGRNVINTSLYPETSSSLSYKNSTFIHEVGHYFQLEHTHREGSGPCKELVTRGKVWSVCLNSFTYTRQCNRRADALCDTEADPNLQGYRYTSAISSDL